MTINIRALRDSLYRALSGDGPPAPYVQVILDHLSPSGHVWTLDEVDRAVEAGRRDGDLDLYTATLLSDEIPESQFSKRAVVVELERIAASVQSR